MINGSESPIHDSASNQPVEINSTTQESRNPAKKSIIEYVKSLFSDRKPHPDNLSLIQEEKETSHNMHKYPRLSRRRFLKMVLAGGGAAVATAVDNKLAEAFPIDDDPSPRHSKEKKQPPVITEKIEPKNKASFTVEGGGEVLVDSAIMQKLEEMIEYYNLDQCFTGGFRLLASKNAALTSCDTRMGGNICKAGEDNGSRGLVMWAEDTKKPVCCLENTSGLTLAEGIHELGHGFMSNVSEIVGIIFGEKIKKAQHHYKETFLIPRLEKITDSFVDQPFLDDYEANIYWGTVNDVGQKEWGKLIKWLPPELQNVTGEGMSLISDSQLPQLIKLLPEDLLVRKAFEWRFDQVKALKDKGIEMVTPGFSYQDWGRFLLSRFIHNPDEIKQYFKSDKPEHPMVLNGKSVKVTNYELIMYGAASLQETCWSEIMANLFMKRHTPDMEMTIYADLPESYKQLQEEIEVGLHALSNGS